MTVAPPRLVLTDVHLCDPGRGTRRTVPAIVVEKGRLTRLCDIVPGPIEGEIRIALDGCTVLPGLIDMHVHMCGDPLARGWHGMRTGVQGALLATSNLRCSLEAGVTSVRDLGTPDGVSFDVRRAFHAGQLKGSRPFVAGPIVTATGGHGTEGGCGPGIGVTGTVAVRAAVRSLLASGVDVIKVATCAAFPRPEFSLEELTAATEEAHRLGVRVACHAHFRAESLDNAIAAGVDSVEHGSFLDEAQLAQMGQRGIGLCPTLSVLRAVVDDARPGTTNPLIDAIKVSFDEMGPRLAHAVDSGVKLLAGTDAGIAGVPFDALHHELQLLVEFGLTPQQALAAATSNAAAALGRSDLGNLEVGSVADLLVVENCPLDDIVETRGIVMVIQNGIVIPRAQ